MSKKRNWSLSSKWKLSKELNDYKQHKQNKKAGGTGYLEEPEKVKPKPSKGGWKCKKNKGDHVWEYTEDKKRAIFHDTYYTYECAVCGKNEMKAKYLYKCADCGSFESWLFGIFNNSDRRKCRKCGSYNIKAILQPVKYEEKETLFPEEKKGGASNNKYKLGI